MKHILIRLSNCPSRIQEDIDIITKEFPYALSQVSGVLLSSLADELREKGGEKVKKKYKKYIEDYKIIQQYQPKTVRKRNAHKSN